MEAVNRSPRQLVLYGAWPTVQDRFEPRYFHEALGARTFMQLFRRPLLILDSCPPTGSGQDSDRLDLLLAAAVQAGFGYIVGVRRYRADPLHEDHRSREAVSLQLSRASRPEAQALVDAWNDLLREAYPQAQLRTLQTSLWVASTGRRHRRHVVSMLMVFLSDSDFTDGATNEIDWFSQLEDGPGRAIAKWLAISQSVEVLLREDVVRRAYPDRFTLVMSWAQVGYIRRDRLYPSSRQPEQLGFHLSSPFAASLMLREDLADPGRLVEVLSAPIAAELSHYGALGAASKIYWWTLFHFIAVQPGWPFDQVNGPDLVSRVLNLHEAELIDVRSAPPATRLGAALTLARLDGRRPVGRSLYLALLADEPSDPSPSVQQLVVLWRALLSHRFVIDNSEDGDLVIQFAVRLCKVPGILPRRTAIGGADGLINLVRLFSPTDVARRELLACAELQATQRLSDVSAGPAARNILIRLYGGASGPYVGVNGQRRPDLSAAEALIDASTDLLEPVPFRATWQARRDHVVLADAYQREFERTRDRLLLLQCVEHWDRALGGIELDTLPSGVTVAAAFDHVEIGLSRFGWVLWKLLGDEVRADSVYSLCVRTLDSRWPVEKSRVDPIKLRIAAANFYANGANSPERALAQVQVIDATGSSADRQRVADWMERLDRRRSAMAPESPGPTPPDTSDAKQ
jgi:hypothetical protein